MSSVRPLFGLLVLLPATIAIAASSPTTTYHVGKRILVGTSKSVCMIRGNWANGQALNYQAWDDCRKMSVSKVDYAEIQSENSYDDDRTVAGIPKSAEIFRIGNEYSEVLLYQDENGISRTIMITD